MRSNAALFALAFSVAAVPAVAQDAAPPAKLGTCTTCHGRDGRGTAPNFPHLAGQSAIYMIEQLRAFRSGARQNEQMTIVAEDLSDDDIRALANYYEAVTACGC